MDENDYSGDSNPKFEAPSRIAVGEQERQRWIDPAIIAHMDIALRVKLDEAWDAIQTRGQ